MKKIFLIFCLFFLVSCQNEYTLFHSEKQVQKEIQQIQSDFSLEQIEYISGVTLRVTPDLKLIEEITKKIDAAQKRVFVEVYIFTLKDIAQSLKKAKKRGLEVKVILEKNVYLASNLNRKMFEDLKKNDIEIVYSNTKNYSLNHTKMMMVDDEVIISTGNYSYSTFKYNRELFLFLDNQKYLKLFEDIFLADFAGKKKNFSDPNLVLSPFSTRKKLEHMIQSAQKSIQIYAHNISDTNILELLSQAQKRGVKVQMILPDLKKVSSNENEIDFLAQNNIAYRLVDKPEIHAKTLLVDGVYLSIGSINYSRPSIDENREIGLILKNPEIISQFQEIFLADFTK